MPTVHVRPDNKGGLQEIAAGILKSKRIVVVTGAGISTNSGIPDFRSENGLYSLIQAQFDAAAKAAAQSDNEDVDADTSSQSVEENETIQDDASQRVEELPIDGGEERPPKRRKLSSGSCRSTRQRLEDGVLREMNASSDVASGWGRVKAERDDADASAVGGGRGSVVGEDVRVRRDRRSPSGGNESDTRNCKGSEPAASLEKGEDSEGEGPVPHSDSLSPGRLRAESGVEGPREGAFRHLTEQDNADTMELSVIVTAPQLWLHSAPLDRGQRTEPAAAASSTNLSAFQPISSNHRTPHPHLSSITPRAVQRIAAATLRSSSPLSSPPVSPFVDKCLPDRRSSLQTPKDLTGRVLLYSSSPLSSPPTVLFDPYDRPPSPCASSSESGPSSTAQSEVETDETPLMTSFSASQASASSRSSLPNIKGRDLFDSSIWSCPIRTSVFYTFATTLREKAKDADPTHSHHFISHLRDRGKLVRCYTQNIDRIEEKVGLSTRLQDGPGSRGRFSRKSLGESKTKPAMPGDARKSQVETKQGQALEPSAAPDAAGEADEAGPGGEPTKYHRGGVECVYLHGSLESLRCFQCGRISMWDHGQRLRDTLAGLQPECPHCAGATAARQERGKRALGIGKLRPDIVLYGEEHPDAHLISPIVTHDLGLNPDLMLILGTSLKVHGLKVLVREFAKAVHGKGGKVLFVNFTKPPESSWGDVIDYWIEWDCDAWVNDLKEKIPRFWQSAEEVADEARIRRESIAEKKQAILAKKLEEAARKLDETTKPPRPPARRPNALRDDRINGAYLSWKIQRELRRLSGRPASAPLVTSASGAPDPASKLAPASRKPRPAPRQRDPKAPTSRRARKSAPAASTTVPIEGSAAPTVTVPDLDRTPAKPRSVHVQLAEAVVTPRNASPADVSLSEPSSILAAVKSNPRRRKRKTIDGEEVTLPTKGLRSTKTQPPGQPRHTDSAVMSSPLVNLPRNHLKLPPLQYLKTTKRAPPLSRAWELPPLEPVPLSTGPLGSISTNILGPTPRRVLKPFFLSDPLEKHIGMTPPPPSRYGRREFSMSEVMDWPRRWRESEAAMALSAMKENNGLALNG